MLIPHPFLSRDYSFRGLKNSGVCAPGGELALDLWVDPAKFEHGIMVNGVQLISKDAVHGDTVVVQVIDKDNIIGAGANFVVAEFTDWFIDPAKAADTALAYGDIIPPYFYLRIIYKSVGTLPVPVYLNYYAHKIS